ncbi:ankyrin repeat domain-containing protein [Flavobacterium sp. ZT3R17]|uniref:ankyrin repeat domain-containing protein n=1 Tax=Flavobacterium cryoconiti TaxID=3398736 RepID=UPI003A8C227E
MKKSIVYLGIALVTFSTVSHASNHNSFAQKEINHSIYEGVTPLCMAIYKGEIDLVKKLIVYGIDVNEKSNGLTPLMIAARYNKVEIIKLLLANGAHLKEKNEIGVSALKYAQISNAKESVVFLKLSESKAIASL